ncbi:MAG: tetratricopeptide repeat protein [Roseiflexus sp.]
MREEERYTGAWATPDLIGRAAILAQIDAALSDTSGSSVVALYGPGRIGKTRILNDTLRQSKPGILLAQRAVDLYDMRYHSSLALADAIYTSLGVAAGGPFRAFERERERQYKAQASGDVRQIAAATRDALQAFAEDFSRFSRSQHVVIALDTLERIAYGASEQRPPFQVAASWQWLVETLPDLGNVTVLIAGRNQIRHLFPALAQHPALRLTTIEVGPFTLDETNDYLDAVARAAEREGEQAVAATLRSLTPLRREQIYHCSGGAPIVLALLADYISIAGFGQLPGILDIETDPAHARAELERQIVERMMDTEGIRDTLPMLGRAPKGVNDELLAHMLDMSVDEARNRLEAIKRLSFIKIRDERYFLHDEMYAILERQIYSAPADAPEAERVNTAILAWYQQHIEKRDKNLDDLYAPIEQERRFAQVTPRLDDARIAEVQQEIQRLMVERVYYTLRHNPLEGFREYFRLSFYTTFTGNTTLDVQLQAELLVFLDERDPTGQQLLIDGLEREVVQGVSTIRPVVRLYAENDYIGVIRHAQRLRQEEPHILQTAGGSTEAALNIWEALARLGRASKEEQDLERADRLLDAAERRLIAIVEPSEPSEARRWRARSLLALAYHARGFGLRVRGQIRPAIDAYRRAAVLWRRVDVPICLAWTLNNLGFVESEEGNFADGRALVEEGLAIRRKLGARALIGLSYSTLARVLILAGDYRSAATSAERARRLFEAVEYRLGQGLALRNLAEALRRSVTRDDDPVERAQILRKAYKYAHRAYELFTEMGDRLRQIELLIEEGCALRDLIGIKYDHPSLEEDLNTLMQKSVQAQERAAELARQTGNVFRQVDAWVNVAYAGVNGERLDIIERGLSNAKEAIPADYLITRRGVPDPQNPRIQNRQLFTQLARIHMLIGDRLFAHYRRLVQSVEKNNMDEVAREYARLAASFVDEPAADVQQVDDCLRYAVLHYALAFEYDRLYNLSDSGGLRAQNKVYNRLKDLDAAELDIVAQAVHAVERDYPTGRSAMRNLLESRALLIE